jgi:predicted ArsR family transcriptional regulator
MNKLVTHGTVQQLSKREKSILVLVETYPGIQSGAITEKLDINVSSVKRALTDLVDKKLFEKDGVGRGTGYYIL